MTVNERHRCNVEDLFVRLRLDWHTAGPCLHRGCSGWWRGCQIIYKHKTARDQRLSVIIEEVYSVLKTSYFATLCLNFCRVDKVRYYRQLWHSTAWLTLEQHGVQQLTREEGTKMHSEFRWSYGNCCRWVFGVKVWVSWIHIRWIRMWAQFDRSGRASTPTRCFEFRAVAHDSNALS